MRTKSVTVRLGKLAALLALFGLSIVLNDCSSTTNDDDAKRAPVTYGIGGYGW